MSKHHAELPDVVDAPHRRPKTNSTSRRLIRAASFAMVRGAAYATGTAAVSVLVWWLTSR
ncbi:hypothetical protein ACFY19_21220 [Streptosporangium saharense]|uniref:hypothetical protein n=1 Tax=Streptosporangium saharense TaxID=1706840 RepID=UPI0036BA2F56